MRELPIGMGTGRAMSLSIFAGKNKTKQKTHKNLFLYSPLSSQAAPVISNCVCTGEFVFCLSIEANIERREERGFGMRVCNKDELREHHEKLFVSLLSFAD